jgi:hypothetical protein
MGVTRFQPFGGRDLPPYPHRLVPMAGLSQFARPLEGIPWLAGLADEVLRPYVKGRSARRDMILNCGKQQVAKPLFWACKLIDPAERQATDEDRQSVLILL